MRRRSPAAAVTGNEDSGDPAQRGRGARRYRRLGDAGGADRRHPRRRHARATAPTASPRLAGNTAVDVTGWTLSGLTVTPPADSDADFALTVTATSTEASNGDTATTIVSLPVTVVRRGRRAGGQRRHGRHRRRHALRLHDGTDFGYSDPDDSPANALAGVKIDGLPAAGQLLLGGVAVTAGEIVAAADIAAGKLTFAPGANENGAGYASFTFQVQDDGGTANGGVDLDPDAEPDHHRRHRGERPARGERRRVCRAPKTRRSRSARRASWPTTRISRAIR